MDQTIMRKGERNMLSDQMFFAILIIIGLVEAGGICWIMEKKETRIKGILRKSEIRRKKHLHDYYCSQEAERLYNKFNYREGGMSHE